MRKLSVLVAILVLGGLVATAQAETIWNPLASTPTFFTSASTLANNTTAAPNFTGGAYTADGVLDNAPLSTSSSYKAADWQNIQMGHDSSYLYVYVHYYNTGVSTTITNPGGSTLRNNCNNIYVASDFGGAATTTIDGLAGVNFRFTNIDYYSSGPLAIQSWNGTGWSTASTFAWSTEGCYAKETSSGGYYLDIEFRVPLSVLGTGSNGVAFNWVADSTCSMSSGGTYNYDRYLAPDGGFNRYAAPTPEPGTLAIVAMGLVGLLCYAWRKR